LKVINTASSHGERRKQVLQLVSAMHCVQELLM
jgi:hypothetical protein